MAAAYTLKGSGDFDAGTAKWRVIVVGAGDQSEAFDKAAGEAPLSYLGVSRGPPAVADQGGGVFYVEFAYSIRNEGTAPTLPPGESQGAGNVSPPERSGEGVGTDLSFTFGGKTVRVLTSKETKFGIGRAGKRAPNFNNLIGYNPKDGSVEGCEVYAKSCQYSIAKQYRDLTYGYLARLFGNCGTTNKKPFRGTAAGESIYIGSDGSYKGGGGEKLPWSITGKFEYGPNQTEELKIGGPGGITIPAGTIAGHDFLWFINEDTTEDVGEGPFRVARPKFAYVERVYDPSDFDQLGMDS